MKTVNFESLGTAGYRQNVFRPDEVQKTLDGEYVWWEGWLFSIRETANPFGGCGGGTVTVGSRWFPVLSDREFDEAWQRARRLAKGTAREALVTTLPSRVFRPLFEEWGAPGYDGMVAHGDREVAAAWRCAGCELASVCDEFLAPLAASPDAAMAVDRLPVGAPSFSQIEVAPGIVAKVDWSGGMPDLEWIPAGGDKHAEWFPVCGVLNDGTRRLLGAMKDRASAEALAARLVGQGFAPAPRRASLRE